MDADTLQFYVGLASSAVAYAFAALLLAVGAGNPANRRIAAVVFLEAQLLTGEPFQLLQRLHLPTIPSEILDIIVPWALAAAYVWLLTTLDSPFLRPLDSRWGRGVLLAYPFVVAIVTKPWWNADWIGALIGVHMLATTILGLAVSIRAFRRAPRGTAARARAKWFLIAFGTRDSVWVLSVAIGLLLGFVVHTDLGPANWGQTAGLVVIGSIIVYVPLLAYGILRTQLFDIDLRIRWGIQKGTVIAIIVALTFVAEKLAENILNRTFGWVLGSVMAGLLVFAAPRLNKLGEHVASTALPKVENTTRYADFRKMEVYRAAVESMHETGALTSKERASLDRLREKLGISVDDARALEADAAVPPTSATSSSAGAPNG